MDKLELARRVFELHPTGCVTFMGAPVGTPEELAGLKTAAQLKAMVEMFEDFARWESRQERRRR